MGLKQRFKSVLYAPKHIKPTDENIFRLLLPSLIGVVICMVCLAGMTWAWFTASVITPPQTIIAANYDVTVSVDEAAVSPENGQYTLTGGEHTVTLTATGNASTGYCKIIFNDNTDHPYYTPQFPNPKEQNPATEFTFTVKVSGTTEMTIIPTWGTYTGTDVLDDKPLDLTPPPSGDQNQPESSTPPQDETASTSGNAEQTYTVKEGDSLWKIAQGYDGISADDIAEYNGIENPNALQIGQVLNIPSAEDGVPEKPTTSVSEQTEPESSAPDTTSNQTADTDTTSLSVSEQGGSESTQLEGESHDNSAGE